MRVPLVDGPRSISLGFEVVLQIDDLKSIRARDGGRLPAPFQHERHQAVGFRVIAVAGQQRFEYRRRKMALSKIN